MQFVSLLINFEAVVNLVEAIRVVEMKDETICVRLSFQQERLFAVTIGGSARST